uniref:Uncharacterized protein n=1 Tax=Amphimedon queenslandica TaxID=400682 RepID=A0A1X7USI5_AMPQE
IIISKVDRRTFCSSHICTVRTLYIYSLCCTGKSKINYY